MKHDVLNSIAHNVADSLAGGMGFLIGVYQMDVFGEAAGSEDGFIEVDLLTGATCGGAPSASLAEAIRLYARALPEFCERHGASLSDFRRLTVRYYGKSSDRHAVVEIEDARGRCSVTTYVGSPLQRWTGREPFI